jgi:hypothetical protein
MRYAACAGVLAASFCGAPVLADPLVVTTTNNATTLANTIVGGSGIVINSATFTGHSTSAGTFTGGTGILPFNSGIVLSTGRAVDVVGPNNVGNKSTSHFTAGDSQLDAIVSPN